MMNNILSRVFISFAVAASIFAAISIVFLTGSHYGKTEVMNKWNQEKKEHAEYIIQLKAEYAELEFNHRQVVNGIRDELQTTKAEYQTKLSNIESDYINRLQLSETRTNIYKHKAEAGTLECRSLADITTELDNSIEQGRRVVRELSETLRQRDREITLVGRQLLQDRSLCE